MRILLKLRTVKFSNFFLLLILLERKQKEGFLDLTHNFLIEFKPKTILALKKESVQFCVASNKLISNCIVAAENWQCFSHIIKLLEPFYLVT